MHTYIGTEKVRKVFDSC